jgi:hypothetical protein
MLDLTERLVAQSIRAISRKAARADSFEAWRFLDESATAAAALPHTREAYPSFRLRLYDTDHKGTESASMWHCGYASSSVPLKNGCRNALRPPSLKFNFGKQLRLNRKCRNELFAIEQIKDDQHDLRRSPFQLVLQI